jgi:asparagine synthase (glutamine-hydrolysing)
MDDLFHQYINPAAIEQTGILNVKEVMHEFKKYEWYKKHHKEYNIEKMWRILSFMMWHKKWMT